MLKSWKFWMVNGAIVLLTLLFVKGFQFDPKFIPSPLLEKPAPAFVLKSMMTGEEVSLNSLKGTPFLLNFWASWCVACREEAKVLEAAHREYGQDPKKFRVIGIAVQDQEKDALAFAKRFGKTYYLALDTPEGDYTLNYGLYGVPESFFIDAEGIIRYKKVGPVTTEYIAETMEKMAALTKRVE